MDDFFAIALASAIALNLDTIRIATLVWEQPALAEKLKSASSEEPRPADAKGAIENGEHLVTTINKLAIRGSGFPVGWPPGHFFDLQDGNGKWEAFWVASPSVWYRPVIGWFITAVAALFGAPFWFDILQSVVRLKGAGPSPDEKTNKRAASS